MSPGLRIGDKGTDVAVVATWISLSVRFARQQAVLSVCPEAMTNWALVRRLVGHDRWSRACCQRTVASGT